MHRDSLKNKQGEWAAWKWEWKITQKMLFIVKIAGVLRAAVIIFASKKQTQQSEVSEKGQQNDQRHNGWKEVFIPRRRETIGKKFFGLIEIYWIMNGE